MYERDLVNILSEIHASDIRAQCSTFSGGFSQGFSLTPSECMRCVPFAHSSSKPFSQPLPKGFFAASAPPEDGSRLALEDRGEEPVGGATTDAMRLPTTDAMRLDLSDDDGEAARMPFGDDGDVAEASGPSGGHHHRNDDGAGA